tara:strand:+ start:35189 stop:38242 length:3054 start_codon:yes stop_codon:yes gene_type:complete
MSNKHLTKTIKLKKLKKKIILKHDIKLSQESKNMKRYNGELINILNEIESILSKKGDNFRAKWYRQASDSIILYDNDISSVDDLKNVPKIGKNITNKLEEYINTGKILMLEKERKDPINVLTRVYGIGPKKATEFVNMGITSIKDLNNNSEKLTNAMKAGLKYYDDIEKRIPRNEIDSYNDVFSKIFSKVTPSNSSFEIVGSYRRKALTSGDIDLIITNKDNDKKTFSNFIDALIQNKIIVEVLSRGNSKCLTITKLDNKPARRVDLLYAPPDEYPFAILYFTGSKIFNTLQRERAVNMGYTLNEHGLYHIHNGKKTTKIEKQFKTEQDIFKYLGMKYLEPSDRIDSRSIKYLEKKKKKINVTIKNSKKSVNKSSDKSNIELFKKEGIIILKTLSEEELSSMLKSANNAYYCNSNPIMSDNEYDILRETTLSIFPTNLAALEGHINCNMDIDKKKATLPYEMWSMDKIKPDTNALKKWQDKYNGPYVLSCKLDGVSGLYSSEGNEPKLYTRGNGKIGQDISHIIPYLNVPNEKDIVIRGEFIIKKSIFNNNYKDKFANPRNFVAGVINQKKIDIEKLKNIDFVVYEVIKPILKPSEQFVLINSLNNTKQQTNKIILVKYEKHENINNILLSDLLVEWRKSYDYEIDGVICINDKIYSRTSGNPDHAFAFKMVLSDQIAEAKVLDVIWTPSKDGYLKPRVQIEPIILNGVTIEYATGFNAKFIKDNKIGIGSLIKLIRSGDVIPHITDVIQQSSEPMMPSEKYIWNESNVDIMLENKESNEIVINKTITGFFKIIGVDGLSTGNIKRIVNAEYDNIPKIIKMTKEDFLQVDGFKEKLATKISIGIKEQLKKVTLPELMQATNIFGRGFGEKRFSIILSKEPTILTSKVSNVEKINKVKIINGMAEKSANKFVEHIDEFIKWIIKAELEYKLDELNTLSETIDTSHPLYNKKIAITGFRDSNLIDKLKQTGAVMTSSINKKIFMVIVKDKNISTGKIDEARKLNLTIMTPAEVYNSFEL